MKDGSYTSHYLYDAQGNRVVKTGFGNESVYLNAYLSGSAGAGSDFTAYVNPYMEVSKAGQYTKHFFIGNERVVSKPGDPESYGSDPRRIEYAGHEVDAKDVNVKYSEKYNISFQNIMNHYGAFGMKYYGGRNVDYVKGGSFDPDEETNTPGNPDDEELKGNVGVDKEAPENQYYYHFNASGSTMLLTNQAGEIVHMLDYLPFGESVIDEHAGDWYTRYQFHGKEYDEETGFYYYDGRYYFPVFGVWLNTSSPFDRNTALTPYIFKNNNPETK